MSHDFHQGEEGTIIFDGCRECDQRSADPLNALLQLDHANFDRMRQRMIDVEYRGDRDHWRSHNEARVGKALYYISLLLDRHGWRSA